MIKKVKIALISSFTADLIAPIISSQLNAFEIDPEWYIASFNQVASEVRSAKSSSKLFNPDIILLLFTPQDFTQNKTITLELITLYSNNFPQATILVSNGYLLKAPQLSFYKTNSSASAYNQLCQTNLEMVKTVEKLRNIRILDFWNLTAEYGRRLLADHRLNYLAKIPFSREGMEAVSTLIVRAITVLLGKRKKCLILDLDNVLWGGILAEDGINHLKLDVDGEGKAFFDFQHDILELYESGVILAVCSKNDELVAKKAISALPHMLLREDKFAAIRINWFDKSQNIRSIAEELNLGLDSMVFLDDTEFERSAIKNLIPEITVPTLPADFSMYSTFLANLPYFDTVSLSEEDAKRGEFYSQERKRNEMKQKATTYTDFLTSLNINISVKVADSWSVPRIAQLTQKTNQFNLSQIRYSEVDVSIMIKKKNIKVLYLFSKDDLGEAGIVGVAIIKLSKTEVFLDTFLMSCRVLGRGIEEAFMCEVARIAKKTDAGKIKTRYNPTDKNLMVKNFLEMFGFVENTGFYLFDLKINVDPPRWVKIQKHE